MDTGNGSFNPYYLFSDCPKITGEPTPGVLLLFISITAIPYILLPILYLRLAKKWTWNNFGLCLPVPKTKAIIIVTVLIFAIAGGVLPFLNSDFTPLPVLIILFSIWQPGFIEEFFHRGIIQSRLERVIGQNKAWIYGGILFSLFHVPFNYIIGEYDLVTGVFVFIGQVISGWMFGILYMKTRSLWPGMLVHFLTDGRLASIIAHIFL